MLVMKVFISYRRAENPQATGLILYDKLIGDKLIGI